MFEKEEGGEKKEILIGQTKSNLIHSAECG